MPRTQSVALQAREMLKANLGRKNNDGGRLKKIVKSMKIAPQAQTKIGSVMCKEAKLLDS